MSANIWKVKVYEKSYLLGSILVEASSKMKAENAVKALCKNTATHFSASKS